MKCLSAALLAALLALPVSGCGTAGQRTTAPADPSPEGRVSSDGEPADLAILSGSENKSLEPILRRFAGSAGARIRVDYLGSVDIMLRLQDGAPGYDAVWPANSLWVDLGDTKKIVKRPASIMRSPVVFGVRKSVAERLGWIGRDVTVEQILKAAETGRLRFMMTSATQSNSGACAYLGFLYAFAGKPEVLTRSQLQRKPVREKVRRLLESVDRSAGSSGWLKDFFMQHYDRYDAMVNYEALIIEANRELAGRRQEPLYVVYPSDGLAMADSPLGSVDHGDARKEKLVQKLQDYLLSPPVQQEIQGTGRRVGLAGVQTASVDNRLFNPDWGISLTRVLNPIRFPPADVIREALDLYQTALRKPSFTVYCLDYSGSMQGKGISDVRAAMRLLLNQQEARRYLLQSAPEDVTVVIPFSDAPLDEWSATGNDPTALDGLLTRITERRTGGGTDIYTPAIRALDILSSKRNLEDYSPAVVLMTDGQSNVGANFADLQSRLQQLPGHRDIPVFAVLFGDASEEQLKQITDYTSGRVFDGRKDLVQAFREVRGYN